MRYRAMTTIGGRLRCCGPVPPWRDERGTAIVLALVGGLVVAGVAATVAMLATFDVRLTAADRWRAQASSAASAALEAGVAQLAREPAWDAVLDGSRLYPGNGGQTIDVGGWSLDIGGLTAERARVSASSAWGAGAVQWQPYAWGLLDEVVPAFAPARGIYVAVWVADDPADGDGNVQRDANGRVEVRAEAFGPARTRAAVVATVRRRPHGVEIVAWRAPADWLPDP